MSSAVNKDVPYKITPVNPKPGEKITIQFNPSNTGLENKEVSYIIYSVKNGLMNAEEYLMKKNSEGWEGTYQIPDSSQAIGLKFIGLKSKFSEQVMQTAYVIQLYGKDGKPLKGTKAAAAYIAGYQGVVNAKGNKEESYRLFKEEYKINPGQIANYLFLYCDCINSLEKEKAAGAIEKLLNNLWKKKDSLLEAQLQAMANIYQQILKDKDKSKECLEFGKKKYPEGKIVEGELINQFYAEGKNPGKAEEIFINYSAKYPKADGQSFASMAGRVINGYCSQGKYEEAKSFLSKIKFSEKDNKWAWLYSSLSQSASICLNKGADRSFTEYFTDIALKAAETFINLLKPNPNWLTENQFMEMKKEFTSDIYSTVARVYEKYKTPKEALEMAEKGYKMSAFSKELVQVYMRLLVENNRAEEAIKILDEMIISGTKSEEMLKTHKKAYEKVKGSAEGYEEYIKGLKEKSLSLLIEKIKKSIVKKPAPQFTLTDTEGKKVSLSDYKGKIVILDFWATWCSPCKASFPLMKKAQEKYAVNPDVKFLFINTLEKVENPLENAANFIKTNNYPFHVAVDAESKISAAYEVNGIPSKIFIDREGNVRYTAVGFEAETMMEEIDTVVNLIK